MPPDVLKKRLQAAVDAWVTKPSLWDFWMNWRGTGDGGDEKVACLALVQYARAVECSPDPFLIEQLRRLRTMTPEGSVQAATYIYPQENFRPRTVAADRVARRQGQFIHLVQGITAAVEAAVAWPQGHPSEDPANDSNFYRYVANNPVNPSRVEERTTVQRMEEACLRLVEAAGHYDQAWGLTMQVKGASGTLGDDVSDNSPSGRLLQRMLTSLPSAPPMRLTTWLILKDLLATLFGEGPPKVRYQNQASLLWFDAAATTGAPGLVEAVQVTAEPCAEMGLLLDPLAFGVTVVEETMQRSLRMAMQCCRQSWLVAEGAAAEPCTLRLSVAPTWRSLTLDGDSAGGLLAGTLLATARRQPVDRRRSATVAIHLRRDIDDTGPLYAEDIELRRVGEIVPKLEAAAKIKVGLRHIALHPDDDRAWRAEHNAAVRPETHGVAKLAELVEALRGETEHEAILDDHVTEVAAKWAQIQEAAPEDPIDLRDANQTHRFDCYVPPSYRVERPRRHDRPVRAEATDPAEDEHDASVPGRTPDAQPKPSPMVNAHEPSHIDDTPLLHLLDLMRTPTVWPEAPDWLQTAQAAGPRWLVVYDNAGSGKTVFSHRLQHVAAGAEAQQRCFGHRAPLVVRWEGEWPRKDGRLSSVAEALEQKVAADLRWNITDDSEKAGRIRRAVRYALDERRVVIILDGFDQFPEEDVAHVAHLLRSKNSDDAVRGCRWVITSRVHTVDEWRANVFDDCRFACVRIEPFSSAQQDHYFRLRKHRDTQESMGSRWLEVLGLNPATDSEEHIQTVRESLQELLKLPMALWWIGELIDSKKSNEPLPVLRTLSALAHEVSQRLLQRAQETSGEKIALRLKEKGIPRIDLENAEILVLLERVLTLIGFQLMLEQNYNGRVQKVDLDGFEERCRDRWFHDFDVAEAVGGLSDRKKGDLLKKRAQADHHWQYAIEVLKTIELNHRSVTEAYKPTRLAFRSRKMVEFHAAWYLSAFATDWDRLGNGFDKGAEEVPCAWLFIGDEQWKECWKLAIEMPRAGQDDAVWTKSLGVLFWPTTRKPKLVERSANAQPEQVWQQRPTELMFRVWQVLKRDSSPAMAGILADYRSEFVQILNGNDDERAKLAAQLVPAFVLPSLVSDPQHLKKITPPPHQPAYVRCPPKGDTLTFWMGSEERWYDDEKPRHQVTVNAFWMAACTVTRAQYRLFDPHVEKNHADSFADISPEEDCPVIQTHWYDGFCLAVWMGDDASLPTETEWEGAARAGHDAPHEVIGVPPYDGTFTWNQMNYDGDFPLIWGEASEQLKRTLPVRWDDARRKETKKLRDLPEAYRPNDFGLWQAHGNVDEWCLSVYEAALYQRRTAPLNHVEVDDVISSPVTAGRVIRGGSWYDHPYDICSSCREYSLPDHRRDNIGLRLVWRSGVSPSGSSSP